MKSHKLIKNPKISGKCVLVLLILIFCITMTTFVVTELRSPHNANSAVLRILLNPSISADTSAESAQLNSTKFLLINVEPRPGRSIDRVTRFAQNLTGMSSKNYYYEEQQPVIVHAESALPVTDNTADKYFAPVPEEEEKPDYAYDSDEDYYNPGRSSGYERNDKPAEEYEDYSEGRSSQNQQFDSSQWNYNQWYRNSGGSRIHSAKERPNLAPNVHPSYESSNREVMEYDYPMGFVYRQQPNKPKMSYDPEARTQQTQQTQQNEQISSRIPNREQYQQQQQQQQQKQQQQVNSKQPQTSPMQNSESTLLSVAKGLKTMWDIYQAFSSAWNTIAEHRQRQTDAFKAKVKQQQEKRTRVRINSRKPPKFNSNTTAVINDSESNNDNNKSTTNGINTKVRSTKSPKPKSTTTRSSTTTTNEPSSEFSSTTKSTSAKVQPRRGTKGERTQKSDTVGMREREKRGSSDGSDADATSIGEGRYIKGDPLKGYYDFVITEGSYKFWAIFQTGTAILIIYSVFAAIYYSKVNPLVSDYDYTDYLGGARSLSGGDLDFVDDEDAQKSQPSGKWYNDLMPKAGHSLKFILDAIDKFPVDHDDQNIAKEEDENSTEYAAYPSA